MLKWLTSILTGGLADKVLRYLENKSNSETERLRIEAVRQQNEFNRMAEIAIKDAEQRAQVITTAMQFRPFWIAWSIAAFPTAAWYGWGMLDSTIMNGNLLPDVASLPPQLLGYSELVMNNIFYSGVSGAGLQAIITGVRGK